MDKIETLYPDVIGGKPFRKNTFNPDDLAQYERNMILATYRDGEVLLGDYLRQTASWEDLQRPPFNEIEQLRVAIFQLKMMDILLARASELKLDESDDFKDATRFFKDQLMAAKMREIITEEKSYVSDEEVIDYYQANSDKYMIPKKIHVQEIHIGTEQEAEDIYNRLNQGEDFDQLAEQYTVRPAMKNKQGDLGFIAEYNYPTIFSLAERLEINQYSRPVPIGDKWSIVRSLEVQEAQAKSFEEVARQIKNELEEQKRVDAVDRWLAENRDKYQVKAKYDLIWETIDKDAYE
jgi:parvulin-like peptidyl-prolyl isomerase